MKLSLALPARRALSAVARRTAASALLVCSSTPAAALDLSIPRDILEEGRWSPGERGARADEAINSTAHSPDVAMYVDNVKQIIRRRLDGAFPRDSAGRVICGEASYALLLRPDGSIGRLDVRAERQASTASGSLEMYYVQPIGVGYVNEDAAAHTHSVATDPEDMQTFAQAIEAQLRGIAPYPARSKQASMPVGTGGTSAPTPLVTVTGNIGVKCTQWK